MTNFSRFKNYLNEMALEYTIDLDRGVYVVYEQRWVKGVGLAFISLVEVSGLDVRNDFGKVKDRIDTAMALQEIMG